MSLDPDFKVKKIVWAAISKQDLKKAYQDFSTYLSQPKLEMVMGYHHETTHSLKQKIKDQILQFSQKFHPEKYKIAVLREQEQKILSGGQQSIQNKKMSAFTFTIEEKTS